jgi:hypothetical protein
VALLRAAADADWMQVVLNQGPPCFHLEEDRLSLGLRFCLRAERWDGHHDPPGVGHPFVSLADLLEAVATTPRGPAVVALVAELRGYVANHRPFPNRIMRWGEYADDVELFAYQIERAHAPVVALVTKWREDALEAESQGVGSKDSLRAVRLCATELARALGIAG